MPRQSERSLRPCALRTNPEKDDLLSIDLEIWRWRIADTLNFHLEVKYLFALAADKMRVVALFVDKLVKGRFAWIIEPQDTAFSRKILNLPIDCTEANIGCQFLAAGMNLSGCKGSVRLCQCLEYCQALVGSANRLHPI